MQNILGIREWVDACRRIGRLLGNHFVFLFRTPHGKYQLAYNGAQSSAVALYSDKNNADTQTSYRLLSANCNCRNFVVCDSHYGYFANIQCASLLFYIIFVLANSNKYIYSV